MKAAKPVIVLAPMINLISSTEVRFEWLPPITYCSINSYLLEFKSTNSLFKVAVDQAGFLTHSIIVKKFTPFTVYEVNLVACVAGSMSFACSKSLVKTFKTAGSAPQNTSVPVARLISSKVISIEWLEPLLVNGDRLEYQLLRVIALINQLEGPSSLPNNLNQTETIYIGKNTYYLDTNVIENLSYKYMVIFGNEFGNTLGEWSVPLATITDTNAEPMVLCVNGTNTVFVLFSLSLVCKSPSLVYLKWESYNVNELVNYASELISLNSMFSISNVQMKKYSIMIYEDKHVKEMVILAANNSIDLLNSQLITNLRPSTHYSFKVVIFIQFDLKNLTTNLTTTESYEFFSERVACTTFALSSVFDSSIEAASYNSNKNYIQLNYSFNSILRDNYDLIQIDLNKVN